MESSGAESAYVAERLDHLGIVAGVCREIGLAQWLDTQDERSHERVSVGTATVAMILNGLGLSNRRVYLVPQFFATKPVERLLGPGITAEDLSDDCLGRTLDWLYAHDPTTLFAGIALRARRAFGISARQVHVDTTSFSVSGEYAGNVPQTAGSQTQNGEGGDEDGDLDARTIAITYGYSRDRRADLKQWMLALATTREGDVPLLMRPVDGNASDQVSLVAAVEALSGQLRDTPAEESDAPSAQERPIFVADGGRYSEATMTRLNAAGVAWVSRVPATLTAAKTALERAEGTGQLAADGQQTHFWSQQRQLGQGAERWCVVRTPAGEKQARAALRRRVEQAQTSWTKRLGHLGNRPFACEADARAALAQELKTLPATLTVQAQVQVRPRYAQPGRPAKDDTPSRHEFVLAATVSRNHEQFEREVRRAASFIVATNVLDPAIRSDEELIATYKDQHSVERGFAFLKDPLFLASSVFLKQPARIVALSLIMVLGLLIYRLAEHRLREQLAATGQTFPDQLKRPANRPTMRWVFQCFEGIDLLHIRHPPAHTATLVLRLEPLHRRVLALLGPTYEQFYESSN